MSLSYSGLMNKSRKEAAGSMQSNSFAAQENGEHRRPTRQPLSFDTSFMLVTCLIYFLPLKMEATFSSETSIDCQMSAGIVSPTIEVFRSTELYHQ
jgi:hypothetical protein